MPSLLFPVMLIVAVVGGLLDRIYISFLVVSVLAILSIAKKRSIWLGLSTIFCGIVLPGVIGAVVTGSQPVAVLAMRSASLLGIFFIFICSAEYARKYLSRATVQFLLSCGIIHVFVVAITERLFIAGNSNSELVYVLMIFCAVGAWGMSSAFIFFSVVLLIGFYLAHAWTLGLGVATCFSSWTLIHVVNSRWTLGSIRKVSRLVAYCLIIVVSGYLLNSWGVLARAVELSEVVAGQFSGFSAGDLEPAGSVGKRLTAYRLAFDSFLASRGLPQGFGASDQLAESGLGLGSLHNGFLTVLVDSGVLVLICLATMVVQMHRVLGGTRLVVFGSSAYLAHAALSNNVFGNALLWMSIGVAYGILTRCYGDNTVMRMSSRSAMTT
jgi:hypothetical protein